MKKVLILNLFVVIDVSQLSQFDDENLNKNKTEFTYNF